MSPIKKTEELVIDFFSKRNFKISGNSFVRNSKSEIHFFDLLSFSGGYRVEVTYGVYIKKFNSIFSLVLGKRDFKRTIYIYGGMAFENNKKYQRMKLENSSDIHETAELIKEIFEIFAQKFYSENSSLSGVLQSIRRIEGLPQSLGNVTHSLSDEAMSLDLFLTRLLYTEVDFKDRCNYYRETILNLSKQYKIEKGIDGAYLHLIEKLDIESDKITKANWDEIKQSLIDLF
jgi:hypothetical protein